MSSGHLGLEADEGLWACGCGPRVCVEGCRGGVGGAVTQIHRGLGCSSAQQLSPRTHHLLPPGHPLDYLTGLPSS